MSKKTSVSFNIGKAYGNSSKPTVYDTILKEITASEIPNKYIDQIIVKYLDGNIHKFDKTDITNNIPLYRSLPAEVINDIFKDIQDIMLYLDINQIEEDVNSMVEELLGPYC